MRNQIISAVGKITLNAIPIAIMIALIPFVRDDLILTLLYCIIILVSFFCKFHKKELILLAFGFVVMIISESFFISTGVEVFNRQSLFGIMPLWLPFLWAYSFVAIKRGIDIVTFDDVTINSKFFDHFFISKILHSEQKSTLKTDRGSVS